MAKKWHFFLFILLLISVIGLFAPVSGSNSNNSAVVPADIAWILTASAMVFFMTPGLAFFYGGMVNKKNIISTMLSSFIALGLITVIWVVIGFSLAFGEDIGGFIGNPKTFFMFNNVFSGAPWKLAPTIPLMLFAVFQLKFAIITPAIVVGAVAERIKFAGYLLVMILFTLFVYTPLAHWTWHPDGFLFKMGVLDFAGGTVVHISAGCAALAGALVLKPRQDLLKGNSIFPANIPYVILGTGMLWFGWFGFNAGSALSASSLAVYAFATTAVASASAALSWIFFDAARGRKPSALGACIGAVVGLVAITPGAGFVAIGPSIFIGAVTSIISNLAVHWKSKTSIDDTLDVFPCHGLGGIVGMLLTGVFANKTINPAGADGLFYGGLDLFNKHLIALVIVVAYSFCVSWVIFKIANALIGLRVNEENESIGLDLSQHDETYSSRRNVYVPHS